MTAPPLFGKPFGMGLIIIEKCLAAPFFGAAAVVLLVLHARGITDPAQVLFAGELREDSHDRLALLVIGLVPGVSKSVLLALALASIGYLVLEAIEAAGLILGRLWVEWLIVVETGVFLPFEVYELAGHFTWLKVLILAANLLILSYLGIRRVQQARHDDRRLGSRYGNS
ncbi:MAG TPA: DUF2127 domain-containing protein [Chloroflexota bacterium]|nr:DUF2127 domain-containing protein [Chloroflexota bacterium]